MVMDSPCCDFGFAFDDSNFSDRVLRISISSESTLSPSAPRVKILNVSSPILAARSPFFHKLFSNGMRESTERLVTLRIDASEEAGVMELLKFMYTNSLTVTIATAAVDVLTVAHKFDVPSCMRQCSLLLRNLPMTPESVLVYLYLPSTLLTDEAFQPVTVAAKHFYAVHFKDITRFRDEILSLPLADVEAIIASDDVRVKLEDQVYKFVRRWALANYPDISERREILATRLSKFIRYPYMTLEKLRSLLHSDELDPEFIQKVIMEAISFKTSDMHQQSSDPDRRFVERAYEYRPLKVLEFQEQQRCVLYLDLTRDMCASLFPSGSVLSENFKFGGQLFYLAARCNMDRFGFFLGMSGKNAGPFKFEFEFAARSKAVEEFVCRAKWRYTFTDGEAIRDSDLFGMPWSSFIGGDGVYFIHDILHLRVDLTIRS